MNSKRFAIGTILLASAAAGAVQAAERLVFNSVAPCRVMNTRLSPAGALAANETRTFHVVGSTNDFTAQGGHAGGCGLPGFAGPGQPQVQAVFLNVVAVTPAGAGDLRAWASDGVLPTASILNYAKVTDETLAGVPLNIANGIGVPVRQDVEGGDISIKADVSGTHVVADVVGYWKTITLPPGGVGTSEIADGSVTGAKIANGAAVRSLNAQTDIVSLSGTNGLSVSAGGGTVTVTSNATPSNTASRIVSRDGSGNFSAGIITLGQLLASVNGGGSAVSGSQNGAGESAASFSNNNPANNAPAVFVSSNSTSGATAVYAVATASTGPWSNGMIADATANPNGIGVVAQGTQNGLYGQATGTTGQVTGVSADATASPNGIGVLGRGTGIGLRGEATATTGYVEGVSGWAINTPNGVGVAGRGYKQGLYAEATGTGYATGVVGRAVNSPSGAGVSGTGTQNGIWAQATGTTGNATGAYAEATADPKGTGVFGKGNQSGVIAQADGTMGWTIGLNGWAVANPAGVGAQGIGAGTGIIGTNQSCLDASVPGGCATPGIAGQFVTGSGGTVLLGQVAVGNTWTPVFRVDSTGKGFFNGGTQTGGADFAESVSVAKSATAYGPGDLLAVDAAADRQLALATQPYSTMVAGIYSTMPGILGTLHPMNERSMTGEVPVAIVGIVPCKVSAENGPIQRGDLLVSSSTPGFAMKGTDTNRMLGAVVGKAMGRLLEGTGVIEVLVTLQ